MGLLDNQTQGQYYEATTGQGDYQFTSLDNIISDKELEELLESHGIQSK